MFWKTRSTQSKLTRVLFLHYEVSNTGSTRVLLDFLRFLSAQRLDFTPVLCFYLAGPLLKEFESLGFPTFVFDRDVTRHAQVKSKLQRSAGLFWFLYIVFRIRPALLYANTVSTSTSVLVAGCLGIRTIVHVHEGPRYLDRVSVRLRLSVPVTNRFIAVSEYCAKGILTVARRPADVVHNWLSDGKKETPGKRLEPETTVVIGIVGTIDRNKHHLLAFMAIASLAEKDRLQIKLKITGAVADPEFSEELKQAASLLGVSDLVEFAEEVTDTAAIYDPLDVVLITSMEETFSLVALEAVQFGKSIVAADVGGIREAITAETHALFFRPGDWRSLAAALEAQLNRLTSVATRPVPIPGLAICGPVPINCTGAQRLLELIHVELRE